jgi:hypothetical protein
MSDVESFSGADQGGEGFDPAAFEKFKERMKAAAAQLKAIQASEQKQKKTEDELIKILLKFITSGKQNDILMLVLRMLEMNVPAGFIVSLLLISNAEIQQELNIHLLPSPDQFAEMETAHNLAEIKQRKDNAAQPQGRAQSQITPDNTGLIPSDYMVNKALPLKVKIAVDAWIKEILRRTNEDPQKILQPVFAPDGTVNLTTVQLATFCLRDFLESEGIKTEYDKLKDFTELFLGKILNDVQEELKNRKNLPT